MSLLRENFHNGNFLRNDVLQSYFNIDGHAFLHIEIGISGLTKLDEFKEKSVILKWQKNKTWKIFLTEEPSPPRQEAGTEWSGVLYI